MTKNIRRKKSLIPVLGAAVLAAVILVYLCTAYRATEEAEAAFSGNETVTVTEVDGGYFFDGPGETSAIVFYPGGKVECTAYGPLLLRFAELGADCFLAEMPFNLAFFGGEKADRFIGAYDYSHWYLAGHSLGGVMAAGYAAEHPETVDGVILLAAYSIKKTGEDQGLLSFYGTEDTVLNMEAYEENRGNWPERAEEYVIEGGNHARYGNYGRQSGDGEARITSEEQQAFVAETVSRRLLKEE